MTTVQVDEIKCKGIVQQGPRAGLQCQKERPESGYCVYHQRNYEYDTLVALGKKVCSGFFRGCDTELSEEDVKQFRKFCAACRLKKSGKQFPCKHTGCSAKILKEEDKYCNKHTRELLRDDEKENNVQYCDISRGCFNVLTNDIKCSECRDKEKQKASTEMAMLRNTHKISLPERSEKDELFEKQEATASEIKEVWRNLHRNAMLRKILFTLTEEEFETLVIQPCYYCGFYSKHKFIGIDRIDNNKGYISSNCLSACKMCNMIKNADHPNAFLDKVSLICSYRQIRKSIREKSEIKWNYYLSSGRLVPYSEYKQTVEKRRNIRFYISQSEYETLIKGECYLCGINPMEGHRNGIDRFDSNGYYTTDNCRACCGHCNRMKRDYTYDDFIRKCIQIKAHNCDRSRFTEVSVLEPEAQKLRNEYYTAEDIAKFLQDGYLTRFLEWCEEKQKSVEFTSAMTYIASTLKGDVVAQVRKELDNERARKSNQQNAPETKQHLHCGTVYIWLTSGKEDDFVEWFTTHYEKTGLFDVRFKELKESLISLGKDDGVKACKKFMYDEKSRRNAQRTRDEKKGVPRYSKSEPSPIPEMDEPVNTIVYLPPPPPPRILKSVLTSLTPIAKQNLPIKKPEKSAPKQWKVVDIYKYISAGKHSVYYGYLKENNATETNSEFETKWTALLQGVSGKIQQDAEPIIKDFVLWLRNIRHNEVCATANAKKTLEKEDRQHYRADGILALLNANDANDANELAKFKTYTETYTGDKPDDSKWMKRWTEFLADVEKADTDDSKKSIISKFLAAQRKKKYDRAKSAAT